MTPEQKAELRRQCEADGRRWAFSKNPNLDENHAEYVVLMMSDQIQAHIEALYAERLRVQPLIEATLRVQKFMDGQDLEYESSMRRDLRAALTAYQNTER